MPSAPVRCRICGQPHHRPTPGNWPSGIIRRPWGWECRDTTGCHNRAIARTGSNTRAVMQRALKRAWAALDAAARPEGPGR